MVWRKVAHIALGCALLIGFQLYGIAGLVQNEPPRGSVFGVAYSERTLNPLPKTYVRLYLQEPLGQSRASEPPAAEPPPEAPQEMSSRRQGWDDAWLEWYECGYSGEPDGRTWEVIADREGRFQLRGIPTGVYTVEANSRWHTLYDPQDYPYEPDRKMRVVVREGGRAELELALKPPKPFLELIHPQAVYYPGELLRVGLRGFNDDESIRLNFYKVRLSASDAAPVGLYRFLESTRYGWWQTDQRLTHELNAYRQHLERLESRETPIRGRDPEGVFTQYVELPQQSEGAYLLEAQSGPNRQIALVVISSIGVVSKVSDEATELWCTDLRTGQPIANVGVRVYREVSVGANESPPRSETRMIAEARANRDGLARLGRVASYENDGYNRTLVAVYSPRTGNVVHWGNLLVASWSNPRTGEPRTGALYTDRPIYRPGHTVHFKGVARLGKMTAYRLPPPNTPVRITVLNPRDEVIYEARTATNSMGAFAGSFPTSPEAEMGYYTIRAQVGDLGVVEQWVPLSAYRKPTYRITLKPDRELYMPDETVRIPIQTEYYFGMPVPNTQLTYTIYRREAWRWWSDQAYDAQPVEEDELSEDAAEGWDYSAAYAGQVIATGELTTDAAGRATLTLRASDLLTDASPTASFLDAASTSYEYTVEVYALSEGWEGAKGRASFEVAPSVWEARLQSEREFGDAGTVYRYRVRLIDRRTGAPVQAALQWQAATYLLAGDRRRIAEQHQGTLRTDAQGYAAFEFTPETGGDWEITLKARDAQGYLVDARHLLWVWDDAYAPQWDAHARDANALEARLQKRVYEPGEQVELALRTPHRDAVFYITLEGERLYHSQVVRAQGALTRVRLPITREQIPNAFVSVCMVRDKQLVQRQLEYRVGRRLGAMRVQIQTDKPRYEPGETMQVRLQTADAQGNPVPAELSLAVVDEAIYAIREDDPAAVRRAFYSRRWNRVNTDFSAVWLALQGDKGETENIRRDFRDTAFWLPIVRTDARGGATVRVRLPDNITEWRLTAIAHTTDTRIGYARAQVKAAKDLTARLRLPMWLVEGDRTEINAILSNDTDQPREVEVELRAPDGVRRQIARVPARNSVALRWDYTPSALGEQKFVLIARERNGRLRDAEARTLLVKPLSLTETDSRAVALNAERTLTLTMHADALPERAALTLRSFPSVSAIAVESLPYLLDYPYGCVEQTVSRFVPALLTLQAAKQLELPLDEATRRKIDEITQQSLQRLQRMQCADGGWGWWQDRESSAWTTAYAVWGLHTAKQAGVSVPETMYQRGVQALARHAEEMLNHLLNRKDGDTSAPTHDALLVLQTLAQTNAPPPARLNAPQPMAQWVEWATQPRTPNSEDYIPPEWMQPYRATLARILLHWRDLPDTRAHLQRLWEAMQRDALEDRSHIDWSPNRTDDPYDRWSYAWYEAETQAEILLTLLEARPLAEALFGSLPRYEQLLGKTAVGLALGYRNQAWYSSRDTARAVEALLAYSVRYERDSALEGAYEVWLNGQRVRTITVQAQGARRVAQTLRLTGLPWRRGENTLLLRPTRGAPLISLTLEQPRKLSFQHADAPTGPLKLRVYRVERPAEMTTPGERLRPLRSGDTVRTGDLLRIDVVARMPQKVSRLDYTVLETPFPAGCAPFDTEAFYTSWWWDYAHEEVRDDRAVAFRSRWQRGDEYRYTLLVRAESPGEYTLLPAHLWGMYAPFQAHSNPFRIRIAAR